MKQNDKPPPHMKYKQKPTSLPPGKHMGLYTFFFMIFDVSVPNQLHSTTPFTTPFRCEITLICDKLRYIRLFNQSLQTLENTAFFGISGSLEIMQT